jgi:hypothetical protein
MVDLGAGNGINDVVVDRTMLGFVGGIAGTVPSSNAGLKAF